MIVSTELILATVCLAALIFTLTNGLHDSSSVVATFISCGAAAPFQALLLAAICGFVGALTGGSAVAYTVSAIVIIPADTALLNVLLAAMIGAVVWNLVTWKFGFPSSSTHALIGGLVGAVWIARGRNCIFWGWSELIGPGHQLMGITKIVAALMIAPVIGFIAAFILQKISRIALRNAKSTLNKWIKRIQWVLAGLLAYSFGANDTQKIVGIISLALASANHLSDQVGPLWVKVLVGAVMFAGMMLGGWPIMKTIGRGIYTIRPIHSLNSQLSSAGCLVLSTALGAPVSTTHIVVGSVAGVGGADEYKMVNWKIGKEIMIAWFITIPSSAIVAAMVFYILRMVSIF